MRLAEFYLICQIRCQEFRNEYYDLSDIFEIEESPQQSGQSRLSLGLGSASLEALEAPDNRHTEINTDVHTDIHYYYQNFQQNFEEKSESDVDPDFDPEYDYNHNYDDSESSIYGHSMSDFDQIKLLNNIANTQVHIL